MNEHALRVLEYDKVANIVASYAASAAGKAAVEALRPIAGIQAVTTLLGETREFTGILRSGDQPPLDGIYDIGPAVAKLKVDRSVLSPAELLNTAATLAAGRRVKSFFQKYAGKSRAPSHSVPLLMIKADAIRLFKQLEGAVTAAIDEKAEVRDSASPDLRRIRKQIARVREDILDRMSGIMQDSGYQKIIQEPVITIRDDRYVLPLKPNFRKSLKGVVHGQSGSRATLFVEPLDVLEQNNRLAELRMDEREEVERILRELTGLLAREADGIEATVNALTALDSVYAKARYGIAYDCSVPELSPPRHIRLRRAGHPLLTVKAATDAGRQRITLNDITLDGEQRVLILSGPNAGGKTAILKTVGLLCLMAQAGFPITAAEGSELPCFGSVFADIGDEQSLEQDLSTFSSHVSQIAGILRQAKSDSLVLLDELGSGTDPGEGAGLGAAVLESLINRGCITVVTTHHNALKLFGSNTAGAVNAAMEFDPQTLKPTYRFIPGRPGRSYGLDMAARLGVPDDVVANARARIDEGDASLEQLLRQVEENSRAIAVERQSLESALTAAQAARDDADDLLRETKEEARKITSKAKADAREVLAALRQRLRELSRTAALEHAEVKNASAEVEALVSKLEPAISERSAAAWSGGNIRPGDSVRIAHLNETATVLGVHRGQLELEVKGKKIKLSSMDVLPVESVTAPQPAATVPGWGADLGEDESTPDRLNIIGLRVDEGLSEVGRFIDRAVLGHLSVVTVIHGLGTGALKAAVTDYLKQHPLIASIRPGETGEGGAGVTVAELKT